LEKERWGGDGTNLFGDLNNGGAKTGQSLGCNVLIFIWRPTSLITFRYGECGGVLWFLEPIKRRQVEPKQFRAHGRQKGMACKPKKRSVTFPRGTPALGGKWGHFKSGLTEKQFLEKT